MIGAIIEWLERGEAGCPTVRKHLGASSEKLSDLRSFVKDELSEKYSFDHFRDTLKKRLLGIYGKGRDSEGLIFFNSLAKKHGLEKVYLGMICDILIRHNVKIRVKKNYSVVNPRTFERSFGNIVGHAIHNSKTTPFKLYGFKSNTNLEIIKKNKIFNKIREEIENEILKLLRDR